MQDPKPANIEDYIAGFPPDIKSVLETVRKTIHEAALDATETIKYAMPTFVLYGNLVHFAAFKNHLGLYPAPTADVRFAKELSAFKTGRGSIRFPYDKPIPLQLITRIVKARVKELKDKSSAGKKSKNKTP